MGISFKIVLNCTHPPHQYMQSKLNIGEKAILRQRCRMKPLDSLIPRPFPPPVFHHFQYGIPRQASLWTKWSFTNPVTNFTVISCLFLLPSHWRASDLRLFVGYYCLVSDVSAMAAISTVHTTSTVVSTDTMVSYP